MALNERQTNNLRSLDLDYGDGLFDSISKIEATTSPVLIIGLGGLGGKTVNEIKKTVIRKMKPNNTIYYLAVDCAEKDFKKITKGRSEEGELIRDEETFNIFNSNATAATIFPDNILRWKDPTLTLEITANGAGGIRQRGRYLLTNNVTEHSTRSRLHKLLMQIKTTHQVAMTTGHAKITIIFVAGVSGGTGSGTFVDMAYLVNDICSSDLSLTRKSQYTIAGYIYLPDVQYGNGTEYLNRNGYAALKELDYFMNLEENGGCYEWPYSTGYKKIRENIYDFCAIIGATTEHGTIPSEEQAIRTATNMIFSTISDATFTNGNDSVQLISSFYDNQGLNVSTWFNGRGSAKNIFPRSNNYTYCFVGYGSAVIPADAIMCYMAEQMFDGVMEVWDNIHLVNNEAVTNCLSGAKLDTVKSLLQLIKRDLGLKIYFDPESGMLKNSEYLKKELHRTAASAQSSLENAMKERGVKKAGIIKQITEDLMTGLDAMFTQYGPYYASYIITTTAAQNKNGCDGIYETLKQLDKDIERYRLKCASDYGNLDSLLTGMRNVGGNIKVKREMFSGKVKNIDEIDTYKRNVRSALERAIYDETLCSFARMIVTEIREWLNEYNNSIFNTYTDVMQYVLNVLSRNANKAGAGEYRKNENDNGLVFTVNVIDLVNDDESVNHLRNTLDNILSTDYKQKFIDDFRRELCSVENRSAFTSKDDNFRAADKIKEIFNSILGEFYKNSIERFVIAYYKTGEPFTADTLELCMNDPVEKGKIVSSAAQAIVDKLIAASEVLGKVAYGKTHRDFAANQEYFVCPKTLGDDLVNTLNTIISNQLPGIKFCVTAKGSSIEIVRSFFGIPLAYITNMDKFDDGYTLEISGGNKMGLHLNQAPGSDWRDLPTVLPSEMWPLGGDKHSNDMVLRRDKMVTDLADRALEKGVIYVPEGRDIYFMYGVGKITYRVGGRPVFERLDEYPQADAARLAEAVAEAVSANKASLVTNSGEGTVVDTKALEKFILQTMQEKGESYSMPVVNTDLAMPESGLPPVTDGRDDNLEVLHITMRKRMEDYRSLKMFMKLFEDIEKECAAIVKAYADEQNTTGKSKLNMRRFLDDIMEFAMALKYGIIKCETKPDGSMWFERWVYEFNNENRMMYNINMMSTFEATFYLYRAFVKFRSLDANTRQYIRQCAETYFNNGGVDNQNNPKEGKPDFIKRILDDKEKIMTGFAGDYSLNSDYNRGAVNDGAIRYEEEFNLEISDFADAYDTLRRFYNEFIIR